jgi:hypothetical protein
MAKRKPAEIEESVNEVCLECFLQKSNHKHYNFCAHSLMREEF